MNRSTPLHETARGSRLALLLVAMGLIAPIAHADMNAAIEMRDAVDATEFYAGQGFLWQVSVAGHQSGGTPHVGSAPAFFMHAFAPEHVSNDAEGRVRTIYRYRLIPRDTGELTLPSFHIEGPDGVRHELPERAIEVGRSVQTENLRLVVSLNTKQAYVGQPVVLTCEWLSALPLSGYRALDLRLPALHVPGMEVIVPSAERAAAGAKGTLGLPLGTERAIATLGEVMIDGKKFTRVGFERLLVPTAPGRFRIRPSRLLCSFLPKTATKVHDVTRYPSYFDNDLFRDVSDTSYGTPAEYVRYGALSEPLVLEVVALPEAGRPQAFTGWVGRVDNIEVSLDTQRLTIGDPVRLTLRLAGVRYPDAIRWNGLANDERFLRDFWVPDRPPTRRVEGDVVSFTQVMKPRRTAVTAVPEITLAYFDLKADAYALLTAEPQALHVKPSGDVTTLRLDEGAVVQRQLTGRSDGIWHNLGPADTPVLDRIRHLLERSWWFWVWLPPCLAAVVYVPIRDTRRRRDDPVAWRRARAFRRLQRDVRCASSRADQYAGVRRYFATMLGIHAPAQTFTDIVAVLRERGIKMSTADADTLQTLYDQCERCQFAREGSDAQASGPSKASVLKAIHAIDGGLR